MVWSLELEELGPPGVKVLVKIHFSLDFLQNSLIGLLTDDPHLDFVASFSSGNRFAHASDGVFQFVEFKSAAKDASGHRSVMVLTGELLDLIMALSLLYDLFLVRFLILIFIRFELIFIKYT